jgi:serine/threonine-protein kinase HipA
MAPAAGSADAAVQARRLAELAKVQPVLRLHQEDMCQAMGLPPTVKYQNEGGPTPVRVVQLLREHSSQPAEDIATFVGALAFNWLIAGTDAHAKNYSLLHASGGQVRLAPLYDLASALPLPGVNVHRLSMAMRIGSEYRIRNIVRRHWEDLARDLSLDADSTVTQVVAMAAEMPARLAHVRDRAIAEGLSPAVVDKLAELLSGHIARCRRALDSAAPA